MIPSHYGILQQIWHDRNNHSEAQSSGPTNTQLGKLPHQWPFATRALQNTQCGYVSRLEAIGNHHCLWIDLPKYQTFGTNMPSVVTPKL